VGISDRTLVITGMVTFLVTLGCVTIILMKLGGVGGLTGFAATNTSIGYVNVTVEPGVAVTLVVDTVNFGDGTIDAAGNAINTSDGDNGGANPNGFDNPGPFHIRNDGNVFVNVTLNGSTPSEFLTIDASDVNFSFATKNISTDELFNDTCGDEAGGTGGGFYHQANSSANNPFGITMSNNHQMVCPNMSYVAATDEFNVSIFLNISNNVPSNRTFNTTLEFFVTSLGHT
jgi:hypothetical protein